MLATVAKFSESAPTTASEVGVAKRRAKLRSAWISFAGRIVAQILGAAATVGFALVVFNGQFSASGATIGPSPALPSTSAAAVSTGHPRVAVLPFQTYAPGPQDHLAGSLGDLLVTELANASGLRVTSTTSTRRFRAATASVPEIGRELGVSHVVEGSITVDGSRARINAQLVDAGSDQHLWARSYDVALDDVLALERRMAAEIAREVQRALASSTR